MVDQYHWVSELIGIAIGKIDLENSIFYTGPFPLNQQVTVAEIILMNQGDMPAPILLECWEFDELGNPTNRIFDYWRGLPPGGSSEPIPVDVITPNLPGTWPLAVRVRGDTEEWPPWTPGAGLWVIATA